MDDSTRIITKLIMIRTITNIKPNNINNNNNHNNKTGNNILLRMKQQKVKKSARETPKIVLFKDEPGDQGRPTLPKAGRGSSRINGQGVASTRTSHRRNG
jgi:hypothetical protein